MTTSLKSLGLASKMASKTTNLKSGGDTSGFSSPAVPTMNFRPSVWRSKRNPQARTPVPAQPTTSGYLRQTRGAFQQAGMAPGLGLTGTGR